MSAHNENKNVMISVIIPVYNAKGTINRCLDSVLNQIYKNVEVICVDDESTDESLNICRDYQKSDSRVKIVEQKNGGVASARNAGLEIAQGEYVTFIDQDDWLELGAYIKLVELAKNYNADMVVCNYSKDSTSESQKMENVEPIQRIIKSRDELIKYAFYREKYRGFAAFVWNKLFRREMLVENGIIFDDSLKRGDDVLFYATVATVAQTTVYVDESFYHYVQREDSITHTKNAQNLDRLADILIGYERAIKILEDRKVETRSIDYMKCFYVYHASLLYEIAREERLEEKQRRFQKSMRLYLHEYKEQNKTDEERMERIYNLLEKGNEG